MNKIDKLFLIIYLLCCPLAIFQIWQENAKGAMPLQEILLFSAIGILSYFCSSLINMSLGGKERRPLDALMAMIDITLVPLSEEGMNRGAILRLFLLFMPAPVAIIASSIPWTFWHYWGAPKNSQYQDWRGLGIIFLVGILHGLVFLAGGITATTIVHFSMNATNILQRGIDKVFFSGTTS